MIDQFVGKTFTSVEISANKREILFVADSGERYRMYHQQSCCDYVTVEEVCGEIKNLIGSPLLRAEENTSKKNPEDVSKEHQNDPFTWTFYRFETAKGSVVICWYGESNGYYSKDVLVEKVEP